MTIAPSAPTIYAMSQPKAGVPSSFAKPSGDSGAFVAHHDPVMVHEILADLALGPGSVVVDGTLGLGGHSQAFAQAVRPGGTLVGLDWDEHMLAIARNRIGNPTDVRVVLVHSDFRNMQNVLAELELRANGILLDLGLNSAQVDDGSRGFSFKESAPLDMRMDTSRGEPASAMLNRMTPGQIEQALLEFGDERFAKRIAAQVVEKRRSSGLKTTQDLVDCVLAAIPPKARDQKIHPATRTFQAVRILVNGELDGLDTALLNAAWCLSEGGVLSVLSYHSGEDRIVKNTFKNLAGDGFEDLHKKPLQPSPEEIRRNPRSRSAKLRSIRRKPL